MTAVLAPPAAPVVLRADDGSALPLDPARWHAEPSPAEEALLRAMAPPVLDAGDALQRAPGIGRDDVLRVSHRSNIAIVERQGGHAHPRVA